ncbi:MAG TPA: sugar phosphate isomerase/epimerase family protein [Phycisphaerae bacterium]|nr:sugar phosphate isomerase/epimerase family protein [Phycisphaerae bacterium]
MYDWPIGLSTGCFHDVSIFDCLEQIRGAGFSMIEVCSSADHLDYHDLDAAKAACKRIRDLDMEAYSFHAPFSGQIDITSPNPAARARAREDLFTAAEAAAALRVRYFVLHPGPEKGGFDNKERAERRWNSVEVLNALAGRCRELGVGLALENMLPHLFAGPTRDLLWILGALGSAGVGVCLDTGHAHLAGDLPAVVDKLSGHLWMIHVNDNNGQGDDHLPPGRGRIDWPGLAERLCHAPFSGGMILEIAGSEDKQAILTAARRGRLFLRDLSRELALKAQQQV